MNYSNYSNRPQWNPYIDHSLIEANFIESQKAQERIAIRAILSAKRAEVSSEKTKLEPQLKQTASEMKEFSSTTLVNNLKEGLSGAAANAANDYLEALKKPELKNPIKGV